MKPLSDALRFSDLPGLFDAPSMARRKGFGSCLAPCGAYPSGPAMLGALKGANVESNGDGRSNRTSRIKSDPLAPSGC